MSRIKLITREEMNEQQKEMYDKFPSNLLKGLLSTKTLAHGYSALGTALRFTKLSPKIREFAILRVACISKCEYELMQHRELAMEQGLSQEELKAITENDIRPLERELQVILQFVNECVDQVKVTEAVFRETLKYLEEDEVAELTLLIGHYMMTARFLETLEIDLDHGPTSWENVKLE